MVRVIHPGLPLDPRVVLAGYLPNYALAVGATDTSISFEKLRDLSRIHDKALSPDADLNFSAKIREAFPSLTERNLWSFYAAGLIACAAG